jgi:selenocysteine lyase/cysteine desulfurase
MSNLLSTYYNLTDRERNALFYPSGTIKTPFTKIKITYADYIASGQPCALIENYMIKHVYPYCANTHSNAFNGIHMKNLISHVKNQIRADLNVGSEYKILFPGNGTTGSFNHLINLIDYSQYNKVTVFITKYEHYSNHLPWAELHNSVHNIDLEIIPILDNGQIDLEWLRQSIESIYAKSANLTNSKKNLVICSITACSNITGLIQPLSKIKQILNEYPSNNNFHSYFFADYACSGPYVDINCSILDALAFSSHKFLGGISCPGVLVARDCLFNKSTPYTKGGGCVAKCNSKQIIYETDIEKKESAGTPNIMGIIKLGKVLELKKRYLPIIIQNEHIISELINEKISYFKSKYPNFMYVMEQSHNSFDQNIKNTQNQQTRPEHLPIFSFALTNMHYNLIVVLLNDLFGIQTRGGIGCCGLLAEYVEQTQGFRGWCRVSFHWSMSYSTIKNIFGAIEFIIINGDKYKQFYKYIPEQNLYEFIGK